MTICPVMCRKPWTLQAEQRLTTQATGRLETTGAAVAHNKHNTLYNLTHSRKHTYTPVGFICEFMPGVFLQTNQNTLNHTISFSVPTTNTHVTLSLGYLFDKVMHQYCCYQCK